MKCCGSKWGGKREMAGRKKTCLKKVPFNRRINENILRKSNVNVKKGFIDKMFGLMMPKGAEKLTLSKMNMGGMGSAMMKWIMKNKNISTLSELIKQAQDSGVKFIACNMSMDVMGIKEEELIDGVEIGGVAKYISESNNANSNLFI